ncbi:conjugal transfer protein TrbF [Novosphingobium resinovorum]|uniref:Conjugal transfer protein TrbF n=1 Tax=Novosphingobium resinovorum TaxID=158500 RepID=A0A1D8A2M4_9SPHN|nr:conjugal transfer protein TrbF [Novosphingobium resinovorum]AOR76368.1 conjugal transfer protein TrbF [Novosphingobium resinovorum]
MHFKRSVPRYGQTMPAETPYQRAGQVWDRRIGSARAQARNWRLMAFGALALSGVMASGLLWLSMQSRVVPYVVAVDEIGEARAVSEAERSYRPTDPQIAWALSRFIVHVRGASLDPVITRAAWLEAYDFATERGGRFLNEYARNSGALTRIGERTVSVQVTSVVRASDKSFQVKWREDAFVRGSPESTTRWTAILTLVERTPKDIETLRKNPLGIYVDAIDWSREMDGQTERPGGRPIAPTPAGSQFAVPPPVSDERAGPQDSNSNAEVLP